MEGKTTEVVTARYGAALADYKATKNKQSALEKNADDFALDFKLRTKKWKKLRDSNADIVKYNFEKYMKRKKFKGELIFKHDDETLTVGTMIILIGFLFFFHFRFLFIYKIT